MTMQEIKQATKIALNPAIDLSNVDDSILYGFGLPEFRPVYTTLQTVAKCMRWQSCMFNGGWDDKEYNENLPHYKRNVRIIGN